MEKVVYLFTAQFPFIGSESFLETEIHYLSNAFDKIVIYPSRGFDKVQLPIPGNVEVRQFDLNRPVYLRKLVSGNLFLIAKAFITEFIKSPHRWKYVNQFKWNFNHLIGCINNAVFLKEELDKDIKANQETEFVCYSYWFNEWATILALSKVLGLKNELVTRAHGYDFDEQQQSRKYHPFRYFEIAKFRKVIQISKYGVNYMKQRFRDSNIVLSYLGVNDKGTNPINNEKEFQIISCSNFVALKRVDSISQILSHLNVPYHWTHYGIGKEMEDVISKVKSILPEQHYTFRGYVANKDLMEEYSQTPFDLFMNVSTLEGLPVSIMEAISFGIPVTGCDVCGLPEIVNEKTGILLEEHFDPKLVAQKIEVFLKEKSRDAQYRQGVKEFWRENFNAERNYAEFVEILKN